MNASDEGDLGEAPPSDITFATLGLAPELLTALTKLGYETPTPVQAETIPALLEGNDLIGQAATGTGKTAAFALPLLHRIAESDATDGKAVPRGLILVPTRELAVQVSEAIEGYAANVRIKSLAVFGGQPIGRQLDALRRGVHVVVGTPGRVIDHIKRGSLSLDLIETVVLDEADEMLDMGFAEDIESILSATPDERQTALFSATMAPRIKSIARRYQNEPVRVEVKRKKGDEQQQLIRQVGYVVDRRYKPSALARILDVQAPVSTLVFCRTRGDVDELTVTMNNRGYRAEALHGGMDQHQRDRVMARLRDGTADLLVATDVAARGIDVDTLTHVVNYDVPAQPESYTHRIGRVGRAGREGTAITLVEPRQRRLVQNIERYIKASLSIEKVPSVDELREVQVAKTVLSVREAMEADDLSSSEQLLANLVEDDDPEQVRAVAIAALKLVHAQGSDVSDATEIPDASVRGGKHRKERFNKNDSFSKRGGGGGGGKFDRSDADTGFVYFNVGSKVGVRAGDLVGAIANECGLTGNDIGPIRVHDHYAVVGVPEREVDSVIRSLSSSSIRGKRAKARRYEDGPRSGGSSGGGGGNHRKGGGYKKYRKDK